MVAYNCGKAAMVALSEGMSVELDRYGIHVLTAVPGLMRTGSHRNAKFGGKPTEEYAWFSRAALHPMLAAKPQQVAKKIVNGIRSKSRTLYLGWEAQMGPALHNLFPETSLKIGSLIEKMMPGVGPAETPRSGEVVAEESSKQLGSLLEKLEREALEEHQSARFAVLPKTGAEI
jgi:hypothetical protein